MPKAGTELTPYAEWLRTKHHLRVCSSLYRVVRAVGEPTPLLERVKDHLFVQEREPLPQQVGLSSTGESLVATLTTRHALTLCDTASAAFPACRSEPHAEE